jgi:histone deacetylase 1/2
MPLKFWDHAFLTATYLINRLPFSTLDNKSPYFLLNTQIPDYKFLKNFGCACFPFLRPYSAHKMNFHSKECIFLGYSTSHKGYKCLDSDGRIFLSKDVLFNEARYPYSELFPLDTHIPAKGHVLSSFLHTSMPLTTISAPQPAVTTPSPSPSPVPPSPSPLPSSPNTLSTPLSSHSTHPSPNNNNNTPPSPNISPISFDSSHGPVLHATPITTIPFSQVTSQSLSPHSGNSSHQSPNTTSQSSVPVVPHRIHPQNTHTMSTRGKNGIVQPRKNPTLLLTHIEPTSYKQAMQVPDWLTAMKAEHSALINNNTWFFVPLPDNRQAIGCKWVFRVKQNPDGTLNKYKARLVAKGFHQKPGFDYNETFSPVVKPVTVRTVLFLAVTNKWTIQQLDINNAFLNGFLDEEVYMVQPPRFESADKTLVCKLNKALYGLKQAPRAWFERLRSALLKLGFCPSKCDPSLFTLHGNQHMIFLLVYVDDIIITVHR